MTGSVNNGSGERPRTTMTPPRHTPDGPRCPRHTTRRRACVLTAAAFGLAGCLGGGGDTDDEEVPEPVEFPEDAQCEVCGMLVVGSYGPNGQAFFDGEYPDDTDRPAYYDSVKELFVDRFGQEDRGVDPVVAYVTDYGAFDYETTQEGDTTYVTGTTDRSSLTEASKAVYVVDSQVAGNMGTELFPFGERAAAESFVDAHGGEVVEDPAREDVDSA